MVVANLAGVTGLASAPSFRLAALISGLDKIALTALVRVADVLVHNFLPTVPPRLGIAYEQFKPVNPCLIYCAVTGYGEDGPLKHKAGYDQVLQTMTGKCTLQGKQGGAPEILYGSVVDHYGSALVAGGVASALYEAISEPAGQEESRRISR